LIANEEDATPMDVLEQILGALIVGVAGRGRSYVG
jgi:hypothetical protein